MEIKGTALCIALWWHSSERPHYSEDALIWEGLTVLNNSTEPVNKAPCCSIIRRNPTLVDVSLAARKRMPPLLSGVLRVEYGVVREAPLLDFHLDRVEMFEGKGEWPALTKGSPCVLQQASEQAKAGGRLLGSAS